MVGDGVGGGVGRGGCRQTDKRIDRQPERQTDGQTDIETHRQADRKRLVCFLNPVNQTDRQAGRQIVSNLVFYAQSTIAVI